MNPNASSFVPGQNIHAQSFVPRFGGPPSGSDPTPTPPPPAQPKQDHDPNDQDFNFEDDSTNTPSQPEPPRNKVLTIGGSGSGSGSRGGSGSGKSTPPTSKPATPPNSKPGTPIPGSSPAANTKKTAIKTAAAGNGPSTSGTTTPITADVVASEAAKVADPETLKDLYGPTALLQQEQASFSSSDPSTLYKHHLNVVFIGHVDAGKSTMGGNLLFLSGMVDKRTMEKYEKEAKEQGRESWYLSWALDSTPQERSKGKTVEVGRAYFETETRRYTILDAPGHKTFVPSMITGAAQADVGILVISARKGEFETGFEKGGQTREHAMLVKTAGVGRLVVVVNKMDESTVKWDKARFDEIQAKLTPFLKATGFNPKTDFTYIPVSAYSGLNLKERLPDGVCPWWDGPSLLEHLDQMPLIDRKVNSPLIMPISEKYKDMGTIVVGKVESGKLRKGDQLLVMPNKTSVEVTAIYSETEEDLSIALCGDNVRIRLRGVEEEDLAVGFVITDPASPVKTTRSFEAQLAILDHKNIITAGYGAVMHVHALAEEVTLAALLHYFDKKTGRKSKRPPQFAKKGQKIIGLLETAAPICVERFEDHPQLGRFTLRDEGKTIAIGKITKIIENAADLPEMAKLVLTTGSQGAAASQVNGS